MCYLLYREAGISAVAFHPTRHMAVSSSYGGDFKVTSLSGDLNAEDSLCYRTYNFNLIFQIWVCNDIQQKDQMSQNSGWACLAVGAYKYDHTLYFIGSSFLSPLPFLFSPLPLCFAKHGVNVKTWILG